MKHWILVVALAATLPALADDKSKDQKKAAKGGPPTVEELVAQADQKSAAGDLDGAVALALVLVASSVALLFALRHFHAGFLWRSGRAAGRAE